MLQGMSPVEKAEEAAVTFWVFCVGLVRRIVQGALSLVEFLLVLRLILLYLGANPETLIVRWLYRGTDILNYPYRDIFGTYIWYGRPIDLTTITGLIGYAIAGWIVLAVLETIVPRPRIYQHRPWM